MENPLAAYLKKHEITQADFARSIGVDSPLVSMWLSGVRSPGLENAFAIERETKGEIPATAWLDSEPRKPSQRTKRKAG